MVVKTAALDPMYSEKYSGVPTLHVPLPMQGTGITGKGGPENSPIESPIKLPPTRSKQVLFRWSESLAVVRYSRYLH